MMDRYDRFWADELNVDPSDWNKPGVSVRRHKDNEYTGVWFFRRNDRVVAAATESWMAHVESSVRQETPDSILDPSFFDRTFGDSIVRVLGPAYQGSLDPDRFHPHEHPDVRFLTVDDAAAIDSFRRECSEEDWDYSALNGCKDLAAHIQQGEICSMTGYRSRTDKAGDPCILTAPKHRGKGLATTTTSAIVARALAENQIVLYQTLESNIGAVKIATRLGFEQYGRSFSVRLKTDGAVVTR